MVLFSTISAVGADFSFLVVYNAWQIKLNITTYSYLIAIFYRLKISYIVNISSFIATHLLLHMYIPCNIAQVLWIL